MANTRQIHELFFHADADAVWAAITNGAMTRQYFFGTEVASSFTAGADVRYASPDGTLAVDGKVIEVEPKRRLVHTWFTHYDPRCAGEESRVTYAIEARGPMTKLTLVHDLDGAPNTATAVGEDGWSFVLSSMKSLLETGRALPMPSSAA